MRTSLTLLALLVVLAGCGADDQPTAPVEDRLEHTLHFRTGGPEGEFRLTLDPDGSAQGRLGAADPFAFTLDDDELAVITNAVVAADLPEQSDVAPSEATDETRDLFEYGDARVEAWSQDAPEELNTLGQMLTQVVQDNAPEA